MSTELSKARQQLLAFDYADMPASEKIACERDAKKIVQHELRGLGLLVEQGKLLKGVQSRLANHGNGGFRAWIETKLPFGYVTAYKRIAIFDAFGDVVQNLNNLSISHEAASYIADQRKKDLVSDEDFERLLEEAGKGHVTRQRAEELIGNVIVIDAGCRGSQLDDSPDDEDADEDDEAIEDGVCGLHVGPFDDVPVPTSRDRGGRTMFENDSEEEATPKPPARVDSSWDLANCVADFRRTLERWEIGCPDLTLIVDVLDGLLAQLNHRIEEADE